VNGKPLFIYAREGKLGEIDIPSHEVYIESIEIINQNNYLGVDLLSKIKKDISLVKGNFRQEEILKIWEEKMKGREKEIFQTIIIRVVSGGGVYMRSLAKDIGEKLNVPALALNIKRTKVGDFSQIGVEPLSERGD
jgi:tRNA U55 pseudouridine synthase TruB